MKLRCPICGATGSAEIFTDSADAAKAVPLFAELPAAIGKRIMPYLALFRPNKQALGWGRVRTLLEPLAEDIKRAAVSRKGQDWAAPLEAWVKAMDAVLERHHQGKLDLPLRDHAYLYTILSSGAERAANREAHRAEVGEDGRRRHAGGKGREQAPVKLAAVLAKSSINQEGSDDAAS